MTKGEKQEWCGNSRRWILWMSATSSIPSTCPYNGNNGGCIGYGCGYYQMKPETASFRRRERDIRYAYPDEEKKR